MPDAALALDAPRPHAGLPFPPDDRADFRPCGSVMAETMATFALTGETVFTSIIALVRRAELRCFFPDGSGECLAPPVELGSRQLTARAFDRRANTWLPLGEMLVDAGAVHAAFAARWIARAPFRAATAEELADKRAWHPWQGDAAWELLKQSPPMAQVFTVNAAMAFISHAILLNLVPVAQPITSDVRAPIVVTPHLVVSGFQDGSGADREGAGGILRAAVPATVDGRWRLTDQLRPIEVHLPSLRALLLDVVEGRVERPAASVLCKLPSELA
ncbi:hypothetical protein [Elioraea sp.]|uniref:hypothetical protein n=1 Tax=Elioraea sp. TaxID=2185103 RepID=UPI0025C3B4A9|nr:hypothetical protein [Elioraea sp.]